MNSGFFEITDLFILTKQSEINICSACCVVTVSGDDVGSFAEFGFGRCRQFDGDIVIPGIVGCHQLFTIEVEFENIVVGVTEIDFIVR